MLLFASCELILLAQIEITNTDSIIFIMFKYLLLNVYLLEFALKYYSVITFDTVVALLWGRAQMALQ